MADCDEKWKVEMMLFQLPCAWDVKISSESASRVLFFIFVGQGFQAAVVPEQTNVQGAWRKLNVRLTFSFLRLRWELTRPWAWTWRQPPATLRCTWRYFTAMTTWSVCSWSTAPTSARRTTKTSRLSTSPPVCGNYWLVCFHSLRSDNKGHFVFH